MNQRVEGSKKTPIVAGKDYSGCSDSPAVLQTGNRRRGNRSSASQELRTMVVRVARGVLQAYNRGTTPPSE